MMKSLLLTFVLALAALPFLALLAPSARAADEPLPRYLTYKDSIDYMMDDGIMSKDEMEDEARRMAALCKGNAYQNRYFKCECVAGAFLAMREKLGPIASQFVMLNAITNSAQTPASCSNTENVAAKTYEECLQSEATYNELATDTEDFCTCQANRMALNFSRAPRLNINYIEGIRLESMQYCRKPENRKTWNSRPKGAASE